jgi:hypothetical protein
MIKKISDSYGLLLEAKTKKTVYLENMLEGLEYLQKDTSLPRVIRLLEDAQNVHVAFQLDDIATLHHKMHEVAKEFELIKHAVIHNTAENTAYAMLIKHYKRTKNYLIEIFSSRDAALQWLNKSI